MREYSTLHLYAVAADWLVRMVWLPMLLLGCLLFWRSPWYDWWKYDQILWAAAGVAAALPAWAAGEALSCAACGIPAASGAERQDPETGSPAHRFRACLSGRIRGRDPAAAEDPAARFRGRTGGARMDFLLAGCLLTAAWFQPHLGDARGCLTVMAEVCLLAGAASLWCMEGYRGALILSELLECPGIVQRAYGRLQDPELRQTCLREGADGVGKTVLAFWILLLQMVPALIGLMIMEVMICELFQRVF